VFGQQKMLREAGALLDEQDLRACLRIAAKLSTAKNGTMVAMADWVRIAARNELERRGLKP
jgi:hypothetical protein